ARLLFVLPRPFATGWPWLLPFVLPPFMCAGVFLSLTLRDRADRAGALYAADLAGGAAGTWAAVLGMQWLGGPVRLVLALTTVAPVAAWLWGGRRGRRPTGAPLAPRARGLGARPHTPLRPLPR